MIWIRAEMKDIRKSAVQQGREGPLKSASKGSDLLSCLLLQLSYKNNRIKNCSQNRSQPRAAQPSSLFSAVSGTPQGLGTEADPLSAAFKACEVWAILPTHTDPPPASLTSYPASQPQSPAPASPRHVCPASALSSV